MFRPGNEVLPRASSQPQALVPLDSAPIPTCPSCVLCFTPHPCPSSVFPLPILHAHDHNPEADFGPWVPQRFTVEEAWWTDRQDGRGFKQPSDADVIATVLWRGNQADVAETALPRPTMQCAPRLWQRKASSQPPNRYTSDHTPRRRRSRSGRWTSTDNWEEHYDSGYEANW